MEIILLGNGNTPLQNLSLGASTFLLGLLMVFIVLIILIGVVNLIKICMAAATKRKDAKVVANKEIPSPVAEPVQQAAPSNDAEVVAAISAAISMYYEAESASTGKSVKFRVRSIKEIR